MKRCPRNAAFTLVEMSIATGAITLTGLVIFLVLNSGFILSSKNTAVNVAHQQARSALLQLEQDLHNAVSLPQLVDATRTVVSGQGPSAGVSFQVFDSDLGQCKIGASAAANQNVIIVTLNSATPLPTAGEILIIPTHQIEISIASVSVAAKTATLTLASNLPVPVTTSQGPTNYNIICFFTKRVSYVAANGQLTYYSGATTSNYSVMGNDITSTTPFSIPNSPVNASYFRFAVAFNLSAADPEYSNRNYKTSAITLQGQISPFAKLTTYQ